MRKLTVEDEQRALRELGITPIRGSGNGVDKEDGRNKHCKIQRKATLKKSITIHEKDLLELVQHAEDAHKVPLFIFQVKELQLLCLFDFHIDKGVQIFRELQEAQEHGCK